MPLSGRRAHAYNKEQGGANKINDIFRRILKGENDMRLIDYKDKVVHFIAIGGCSMSGLAILLKQMGFKYIQGSDSADGKALIPLREMGMKIFVGHDAKQVENASLVVYSAAIGENNAELSRARELGLPALRRDELLGLISELSRDCIGVAGTHGKTTTTGMIAQIFEEAGRDPVIHMGGTLPLIGGSVKLGRGNEFITEACEYVDSFLKLHPSCAIVLNIDADHLDYFKNMENIIKSFEQYMRQTSPDGIVIGCGDDANTLKLLKNCGRRFATYGISLDNSYHAENITFTSQGYPEYDFYKGDSKLCRVRLNIVGRVNVLNSQAALICAMEYGIDLDTALKALEDFRGAGRRFELRGVYNGAKIYHDYGHHPAEVAATITASAPIEKKRLWVVYQPALFSRTRAQFNRLAQCFKGADKVIIIDIYGSREPFDPGINSKMLVDEVIKQTGQDCIYIPTMQEAAEYLKQNLQPGDLCLTMGSGTIDKLDGFIFDR